MRADPDSQVVIERNDQYWGEHAHIQRIRFAVVPDATTRALEQDFNALWPRRNKGTTTRCSAFLQWRIADYLCAKLHFPPEIARKA